MHNPVTHQEYDLIVRAFEMSYNEKEDELVIIDIVKKQDPSPFVGVTRDTIEEFLSQLAKRGIDDEILARLRKCILIEGKVAEKALAAAIVGTDSND